MRFDARRHRSNTSDSAGSKIGRMFGSPNVKIHLVRGLLALGLLALVLRYASQLGWWTLLPAAGALALFGG